MPGVDPRILEAMAVQAVGAACLAVLLLLFRRLYPRPFLSTWAWSWLALLGYLAGGLMVMAGVLPAEPGHPVRLGAGWATGFAGLAQAALLAVGTRELLLGRHVARGARAALLGAAALAAGILVAASPMGLADAPLRYALRVGTRCAVMAGVLAAASVLLARGGRPGGARLGRGIIAAGLALYGLQQLHYTGRALAAAGFEHWAAWLQPMGFLASLDAVLQGLIGVGTVTWLLEEEKAASERARRDLERHERALRESELRFRTLADGAPVLLWMSDDSGQRTFFNRTWLEFTGRSMEDELGEGWLASVHPEDRSRVRAQEEAHLAHPKRLEREFRLRAADGGYRWVVDTVLPRFDVDGSFLGFIGCSQDLTERRKLERQLHHAQRMESVGRLAGGVAHDFNNLLTAVQGYAQLAQFRIGRPSEVREAIEQILLASDRATRLIQQLLAFARRQVIEPEVLDLNQLLTDIGRLLRPIIGEDVELVVLPSSRPLYVRVDRAQMEQVLVNLAVNARDAMPQGGTLTLRVASETATPEFEAPADSGGPSSWAVLHVTDTGCGIPADVLPHIFEPFFTTKGPDQGTGLGLATSYGIVKQNGGDITVRSRPGHGTTFTLYLPEFHETGKTESEEAAMKRSLNGNETVLVVEDEASIRDLLVTVLESRGYRVLAAGNGDEALRLLHKQDVVPDLLVTDMVMPQMSGRELVDEIRRRYPGMRVLFMSGYTDDLSVLEGRDATLFLRKPFKMEEFCARVRDALEQEGVADPAMGAP